MNKEARTALIRARTLLYITQPFYGILALRLALEEDKSIPTLCISHTTIYYNPDFYLSLSESLQMSAVAHEVQHCLLDHINRCGPRLPKKWNAAGDYVINANLKDDGFEIGKDWLFNPAFAGMSADHIYTLLPDGTGPGGDQGPGKGGGWGALDDMKPGDPDVVEAEATEWKIAVIQAANEAKKQGKLPGSMVSIVEELKGNKVDWRERLRRFAMLHAKTDFSWARPQRRMVPFGYYLPSLYSQAMGLLVNAIDTSGSVDDYELQMFGSEINAMKLMAKPQQLINIYCDSRIAKIDEYDEYQTPVFSMPGRGGTDFRPPFQHIEKHGLKPACFIYLTDGEGPFPETPPPYPVMWVMTTGVVAPFGETIRIER